MYLINKIMSNLFVVKLNVDFNPCDLLANQLDSLLFFKMDFQGLTPIPPQFNQPFEGGYLAQQSRAVVSRSQMDS